MVRNSRKQQTIEEQLKEFEARLRAEMLAAERGKREESSGFVPLDALTQSASSNEYAEMAGD